MVFTGIGGAPCAPWPSPSPSSRSPPPAPAALAADDPDAVIAIGSLYEPQNLDNTAGAGQGINEAFNGNVYEALFRLTDAGAVENALVDRLHRQRRWPDLHLHAAARRHLPLRRAADRRRRQVLHRARHRRDLQELAQEQPRDHRRHRDARRPDRRHHALGPLDLAALQPQLRLDRQRRRHRPHRHRGRHRPLYAGRMAPRLHPGPRPASTATGATPPPMAAWCSTISPTPPPSTMRC